MRTQLDRNLETVRFFEGLILSHYQSAKKSALPFSWILEQRDAFIFSTERYKKLPQWAKHIISGYDSACLAFNYQNLEFAHIYNGVFTLKLTYGPDFNQSLLEDSFYVWKGTDKRF